MSVNTGPAVLHSVSAAVMAWGYRELERTVTNQWITEQVGGHFQFLTIQGLAVAWLTMLISLGTDLFPTSQALRKTKRAVFMLALPLAVVIATIYWSLMFFMPELILMRSPIAEPSSSNAMPKLLRLPLSHDLALHAVPGAALILDFVLFEKKYGKSEVTFGAPLITVLAGLWYACWVEYCASYNGTFPYPFLTENSPNIRSMIYLAASNLALVSFWILNALHP